MSFYEVAKVIAYDIPLTVETFILTLAVNRQMYHKLLCAFLHNSLHDHQSYRETQSEDDGMLKKSAGALRVKQRFAAKLETILSIKVAGTMLYEPGNIVS